MVRQFQALKVRKITVLSVEKSRRDCQAFIILWLYPTAHHEVLLPWQKHATLAERTTLDADEVLSCGTREDIVPGLFKATNGLLGIDLLEEFAILDAARK